ncbi:MAG: enolase C-terminal domain-like protein, partial [Cytophagaceae bacterium]
MLTWSVQTLPLKLIYNWKISRNETFEKTNLIVTVTDGVHKGMGEAAPNIRYGETPEKLLEEFDRFLTIGIIISDLQKLEMALSELSLYPSLRFAIESAYIHHLAEKAKKTVSSFLQLTPPPPLPTSYTLPIMDPSSIKEFIDKYNLNRFYSLKIKVNSESAFDMISEAGKHFSGTLRIDGNETWTHPDELINTFNSLKNNKIQFLEQPFPSKLVDEYKYLKKKSKYEIIADESITNNPEDLIKLKDQFHGINMKLM